MGHTRTQCSNGSLSKKVALIHRSRQIMPEKRHGESSRDFRQESRVTSGLVMIVPLVLPAVIIGTMLQFASTFQFSLGPAEKLRGKYSWL